MEDEAEREFLAQEAAKGVERDGDYAEWQGIVRLEVELATRSTAGIPKHTDPEEQGIGLENIARIKLQEAYEDVLDVSIGEVTMTGWEARRWIDPDEFLRGARGKPDE